MLVLADRVGEVERLEGLAVALVEVWQVLQEAEAGESIEGKG